MAVDQQAEAERRYMRRILWEVYNAAEALHLLEDFEEMPTSCAACCAEDMEAYQGARSRLYAALVAVRDAVGV